MIVEDGGGARPGGRRSGEVRPKAGILRRGRGTKSGGIVLKGHRRVWCWSADVLVSKAVTPN